jgi:hypothetical protein
MAKSGIKIKKSTQGTYTARAKANGKTVQQQAVADVSNPNVSSKIKKRAVFAQNAARWRH